MNREGRPGAAGGVGTTELGRGAAHHEDYG